MASKDLIGAEFGVGVYQAVEHLFRQGIVVTAVKVKYPGIDPMLMIAAKTTEGPKICFVGGRSLDQIGRTVEQMARSEALKWREDSFLLDKLAQNGEGE